ncbi:MAG TPA: hypothetical protein VGH10_03210 [Actinomycetota bacterium]
MALWPGASASAATPGAFPVVPSGPATVVLIVVGPTTFESFMRVPAFRQLARAGGAGLMATDENYRSDPPSVYESLGSGAPPGGAQVGLLVDTLRRHGIPTCVSAPRTGWQPPPLLAHLIGPHYALPGRCAGVRAVPRSLIVQQAGPVPLTKTAAVLGGSVLSPSFPKATMVIVLAPYPSGTMNRAGDEVVPIAVAAGREAANELLPANGPFHTLTSETTRQAGLVANVDVAPTVLAFFGIPEPSAMDGSPITVTGSAAPFALHRRHLDQRRIRVPIQLLELAIAVVAAVAVWIALARRRRSALSSGAAAGARFAILTLVAMPIPMALAGWLPRLTYWVTIPYLIGVSVLLALLSLRFASGSPLGPLSFLGAVGAGAILLDLALGGHGLRVPLLGGTMFDGVRLYGLPNAFEATLLAGVLFAAFRFPPWQGGAVLFASGIVAGWPSLGADLGGALTLFVAAGLWWQLRSRGRLRVREVALAAAVALAGLAIVLLASRYLAGGAATHVTHFVRQSGGRIPAFLAEVRHRLGVGLRQVAHAPAALIPLLGLPAALWLTLAAPRPIDEGLAVEPGWRDVIVVLLLSSMVGFFVNDTGLAAAAPCFLYALAALAYPALLMPESAGRPASAVAVGSPVP